jgi:hypothetical protein
MEGIPDKTPKISHMWPYLAHITGWSVSSKVGINFTILASRKIFGFFYV